MEYQADSKDKAVGLLGLVIILFVAFAIFIANPKALNVKGDVAGVSTDEQQTVTAVHNTQYQAEIVSEEVSSFSEQLVNQISVIMDQLKPLIKQKKK